MKKRSLQSRHLPFQRAIALLFAVAMMLSMVGFRKSPVAQALNRGERIPVLVFGTDMADASKHTDTLLVTVLDPVMSFLKILSIPRDTRLRLPGYRFRRINEIYGYHVRKGMAPQDAAKKVIGGIQFLLSTRSTPVNIPYFVQIDYSGFRNLVDLLGGVWVRVKTPMHYDDFAGNYHFHKEPGRYLMSGDEALHYVRFRGATGDRGRMLRQHEFLRNMARRFANPLNVLRFPKMVAAVTASIHTNLSFWDLVYLTVASRHLRPKKLGFYILPGYPRGPYWYMKKKPAHQLASSLILGKTLVAERLEPIVPQADQITVKVWNACGVKGLALRVTKYLRSEGFDVVDWGNYAVNQVPTRVIDRTGQIDKAREVARALSIETFHSEPNKKALADIEVILGKNYKGVGADHQ